MVLAETSKVKLVFTPPGNFTVEVFSGIAVMRITATNYKAAQAIYDSYRGRKTTDGHF